MMNGVKRRLGPGLIAKDIAAVAKQAWTGAALHAARTAAAAKPAWEAVRAGAMQAAASAKPATAALTARTAVFILRLRASAARAALIARRRPATPAKPRRRFGLGTVEAWTLAVSAVFAMLVFVDGPAIIWAQSLDPGVTKLFRTLTDLGKSDWLLIPMGLAIVWLASRPVATFSRRAKARLEAWLGVLVFAFFVVAGSGLIVTLAKRIIGRARPKHFETSGLFDFSPFTLDASFTSFPSGHSATVFAFAAVVTFLAPKLKWPALSLALWLAVSRTAIGAHYPSDAFAGAAFAAWFALWARAAFARRNVVFRRNRAGGYRLKTPRLLAFRRSGRIGPARPRSEPIG